ncbi:MAG: hypothetical protein VX874_13285 [Pseudomonadota bacterium]|nr:hypothetical protein [Pseudomonadota bacterium]
MRLVAFMACLAMASPARGEIVIALTATPWPGALVSPAFGARYDSALIGAWRMTQIGDRDRPGAQFRVDRHGGFRLNYGSANAYALCAARTGASGRVAGLIAHRDTAPDPDGFRPLSVNVDREGMDLPTLTCGGRPLTDAFSPAFGLAVGPYRYRIDPTGETLVIEMPGAPAPTLFTFTRAPAPLDTPATK